MQWLIDIVKEWIIAQGYALQSWVQAQGYLTAGYVINPNFPGPFTPPGGWNPDGGWHTVDVSGFVPENVRALNCSVKCSTSVVPLYIRFRPTGDPGSTYRCVFRTQVANVLFTACIPIEISTDRKFDYQFQSGTWSGLALRFRGWWY